MFWRAIENDLLPTCLERGVGVIVHSPLAKGMLTGKYRPGHVFDNDDERMGKREFESEPFRQAFPIVEKLVEWAADHGRDGAQLAVAWTLAHPAVTSSIVGAKTAEQALHNIAAADWRLSGDDMSEIGDILGGYQFDGA